MKDYDDTWDHCNNRINELAHKVQGQITQLRSDINSSAKDAVFNQLKVMANEINALGVKLDALEKKTNVLKLERIDTTLRY